MIELIERNTSVILGGEGNGGLIYPQHQFCRDGGMTAAMMVHLLKTENKPLSLIVDSLPKYFMIKEKIACSKNVNIVKMLGKAITNETTDKTDGVKIIREDSWALIRASGTEPLIRIMVESNRKNTVDNFFEEVLSMVQNAMKNVG